MIGETLGSYRIVRKIGEGGMGVVYAAEHPLIGRKAAVKLLLPEFSQNQEIVSRFFNEARATTLIKHPGLVDVFDFGYHANGSAYLVMEFLEGESLAGLLRRQPVVSPGLIAVIARQLASAVGAAHDKGIVHRDLKPDNIYLVPDRDQVGGLRVKVLDFGIAKLAADGTGGMAKTRSGMMMGTPLYMSPEQCRGAGLLDHRADIYSLGCILFEMACGRLPFIGEGAGDLIWQHIREPAPRPSAIEPSVPALLDEIILRMLEKSPDARQQSMAEVAYELERGTGWRMPSSPPQPSPVTGATGQLGPRTGPSAPTVATGPGAAPPMTTLGIAATPLGTSVPAPLKRTWLVALVAICVGGGLVAIYTAARDRGEGEVAPVSHAAGHAAPAHESLAPPDRTPTPTPVPAAPERVPAEVELSIDSAPSDADVYRAIDGVHLGRTPLTIHLAPTAGLTGFVLKHAGYKDAQLALPADHGGAQLVTLDAEVATPPARPKPTSRAHAPLRSPSAPHVADPAPPPASAPPPTRSKDAPVDPFAE